MSIAQVKSIGETFDHESVMVEEVLAGLNLSKGSVKKDSQDSQDSKYTKDRDRNKVTDSKDFQDIRTEGIFVDLTFGRGGHTQAILACVSANARVFAMDKDPAAKKTAEVLEQRDPRFKFKSETFSNVYEFCQSFGIVGKVNGVLLDLGVSSPQLEEGQRGFSFKNAGPLDMRMDPTQGMSAAEWIKTASESDIQQVLKEYGEERFYKRIARAIVEARDVEAITTTEQLADIVSRANPAWEKHKHPATRSFQAIRIFINNELQELSRCLDKMIAVLAPKGRLVVISFHSLEDRVVKQFIQQHERDQHPRSLPLLAKDLKPAFRRIGSKQKPSDLEILHNRRARSAVLRVAEKVETDENIKEDRSERI